METGMLPGFVIEQIRRKEAEERRRQEIQPVLELPEPVPPPPPEDLDEGVRRGVVVVEL